MKRINRVSQLFQPSVAIPKCSVSKIDLPSKSYQLMINAGIISNTSSGMFACLPLGIKALEKLIQLIDKEMTYIGGQKILLPALTPTSLWNKTSRLAQAESELFKLKDRHQKKYLLSPTFEEAITHMINQLGPLKRDQLPLRLYQISSKWRDEMKPRLGLLRSKEFIMKDMYTFDVNSENAECTYDLVSNAYENILNSISIPYVKVVANTGIIGGSISHEYRYLSDIGEDVTLMCIPCNHCIDVSSDSKKQCPNCGEALVETESIEVGHTFLLGSKYSKPLEATFIDEHNKKKFLMMGCYGLGLTRILAAATEILSTDLELRWPLILAPYSVCIIPPKQGSKEESVSQLAYDVYHMLQNHNIDVIVDDRIQMTIGKRFIEARKCGYPFVIVIGKSSLNSVPLTEVHNVYNNIHEFLAPENIVNYLSNFLNICNKI